MALPTTETLHDLAIGLDAQSADRVAAILAQGQVDAAASVPGAIPAICQGASQMADTIRSGGRLVYVAAGSSGLMAAADAMELGGTFAIPPSQVRILMAGGLPTSAAMPGDVEDGVTGLERDLADLAPCDTVIAVSASGATPYTLAAADMANASGAHVIGIANNADAPLLTKAGSAILLATPPEVIAGSTRMGAGTAQKIALNMLSTLMAVDLGHIHDGMMVNLVADNIKLLKRAAGIVARIADVSDDVAAAALDQTKGRAKPAVLIAKGGVTKEDADALLAQTQGRLRAALARL